MTALLLTMWVSAVPGYAEEGFFGEHTLPPQLVSAWNATFQIRYRSGAFATAFVIDKQPVTVRRMRLQFLTSGHMVQGHCKKPFGHCPNIEQLSSSEGFHRENDNAILMNHRNWTIPEATVVDQDIGNDLALLEAIVDRDKYKNLQPIPFLSDCSSLRIHQTMFLIGFPDVSLRTTPDALPIDDKAHMIRRWSRGVLVGSITNNDVPEAARNRHYKIGTTADALPGNSGGPALTSDGEFFGALRAISVPEPPLRRDEYPYIGEKRPEGCIPILRVVMRFLISYPVKLGRISNPALSIEATKPLLPPRQSCSFRHLLLTFW